MPSSDVFVRTLVAFYYGNMTRPSADPPRVGLKSTVPSNAAAELKEAVSESPDPDFSQAIEENDQVM